MRMRLIYELIKNPVSLLDNPMQLMTVVKMDVDGKI